MSQRDQRMKIAYLSDRDPGDAGSYSGGNSRLLSALREHVGEVTVLDQGWGLAEPIRALMHTLPESLEIRARWRLQLMLSRLIRRHVERQLQAGEYDVVFGGYAFHAMAGLRLPDHLVSAFSSDATPTLYKASVVGENFGSWFAPSRLLDPWIERHEARVFRGLDLALWPSDWLRDGVNTRYGLDPSRSLTLPWGAGIDDPGPADPNPVDPEKPLEILLVGRDWNTKGGWLVAETVAQLNSEGIETSLTVIGCTPPPDLGLPHLTVHPHLDKSNPEQLALFTSAWRKAHFLMMPSMESYGFAFCEASAFALPSLCLRAGGIPVWEGENGHALPLGSDAEAFAALIKRYRETPETHTALRAGARRVYEDRLNWTAWGRGARTLLEQAVEARLSALSRAEPRQPS